MSEIEFQKVADDLYCDIRNFEGFKGLSAKSYKCPSGVLTIGYGHTHGVLPNMCVSDMEANALYDYDVIMTCLQLESLHPNFRTFQYGLVLALADFVFNVGITKYKNSTLRQVVDNIKDVTWLSSYDYEQLSVQFSLWCYSKGKKLKGLEKRRQFEINLLHTHTREQCLSSGKTDCAFCINEICKMKFIHY